MRAASGNADLSENAFVNLLAGPDPGTAEGRDVREIMADRIRKVLDDQHLVSFDTIFALGDGLTQKSQGVPPSDGLIERAAELREFELPRPSSPAVRERNFPLVSSIIATPPSNCNPTSQKY